MPSVHVYIKYGSISVTPTTHVIIYSTYNMGKHIIMALFFFFLHVLAKNKAILD